MITFDELIGINFVWVERAENPSLVGLTGEDDCPF